MTNDPVPQSLSDQLNAKASEITALADSVQSLESDASNTIMDRLWESMGNLMGSDMQSVYALMVTDIEGKLGHIPESARRDVASVAAAYTLISGDPEIRLPEHAIVNQVAFQLPDIGSLKDLPDGVGKVPYTGPGTD